MLVKLDLFFLSLGLFIGMFIVYVTNQKPNIVVKHPSNDDNGDTVYKDDNGVCYKYHKKYL